VYIHEYLEAFFTLNHDVGRGWWLYQYPSAFLAQFGRTQVARWPSDASTYGYSVNHVTVPYVLELLSHLRRRARPRHINDADYIWIHICDQSCSPRTDKFTIRKYMIAPPLSIFMNVLTADLQILVNSRDIWPWMKTRWVRRKIHEEHPRAGHGLLSITRFDSCSDWLFLPKLVLHVSIQSVPFNGW
jgi:hypothetical protein